MGARDDQLLIDQLVRLVQTQGWDMLATDRSGPTIRVTFERAKAGDQLTNLGPKAPGS